jgi:hypothetical protein
MSLPDQLRDAFTGTRGKVLIVVGLGLTGYLLWTRRNTKPDATTTGDTATDGFSSDAPGTPGYVGSVSNPGTDTTTTAPQSNEEWLSRGSAYLAARGIDAATAYSALRHALDGTPLTTVEYNAVSLVLGALGTPPEGMPALSHAAPSTTTTGGGQKVTIPEQPRRIPSPGRVPVEPIDFPQTVHRRY